MAPKPLIHADLCREIGSFTDTRKMGLLESFTRFWQNSVESIGSLATISALSAGLNVGGSGLSYNGSTPRSHRGDAGPIPASSSIRFESNGWHL